MRILGMIAAALVTLALGACAQSDGEFVPIDIDGEYVMTSEVTESTIEYLPVGETTVSDITVSSSGNQVTLTNEFGDSQTGTRSGNTVTITSPDGTLTLQWMTANTFSGVGYADTTDGTATLEISGVRK